MPSSAVWNTIVFGNATGITVNGQAVAYGYALVSVTVGTQTVPSLLLVPDNTAIELASLSGKETYFNKEKGDYGFDKIALSSDDYTYLMGKDCRILPLTGMYWEGEWRNGISDSWPNGYYWASNHYGVEPIQPYFLKLDPDLGSVSTPHTTGLNDYCPVRLVKKIN